MVSQKWKADALKALKGRLNTAAAQTTIQKVTNNPSHKKCTTLRDKLVKKFTPRGSSPGNPPLLAEVNAAWQAYTTAATPEAGPPGAAGENPLGQLPNAAAAGDNPAGQLPNAAAGPPAFRMRGKGFILVYARHGVRDADDGQCEAPLPRHRREGWEYVD